MPAVAGLCLFLASLASAQEPTVGAPGSPLPFDPAATVGTLAERDALLHPREPQAGKTRRAAVGGQRRVRARGRRSARTRAHARAHGVSRDEAIPGKSGLQLSGIGRDAIRPGHQRIHQLRRNGLHAHDPDGHRRDRGQGISDSLRVGAQPRPRAITDREGASGSHRRVAAGAGRREPNAEQVVPGAVLRIEVRRANSDR